MLLMFTLRPSTTFNAFFQRQLTCCFGIFPISIGIPVVLIDITGTINRGFLPRDAKGILRGSGFGGLFFLLISIISVIRG